MSHTDEPSEIGALLVKFANRMVALPLESVDVEATVIDRVAGVTMRQTWQNPYDEPLEAVYIFPLPGGAAVRAFSMRNGERTVQATVKARAKAREEYQTAVQEGRQAALLEQERDDVFTMQVGNIPPRQTVSVTLEWSERLPFFADGRVEMRIPLVLAPRYIGNDANPYREPLITDQPPTRPLSIRVRLLEPAMQPTCTHAIRLEDECIVHQADTVMDRDFVLRWKVTTSEMQTRGWVDDRHTAMITLLPPQLAAAPAVPRDVVFVLDRSGSMAGAKLASAARAASLLLQTLQPTDRFALLAFDDQCEWLPQKWVDANEAGLRLGETELRRIEPRGGTEIGNALQTALGRLQHAALRQGIVVLLTDGQVTDAEACFKLMQRQGHGVRLFTIGVDTAVNETFLRRLATIGRGTASMVTPGEALETAMAQVGREIGTPVVTDLHLLDVDSGLEIGSVAPSRIPDLFLGRPVTLFFRTARPGRVQLVGQTGQGQPFTTDVILQPGAPATLSHLWARHRVRDLEDAFRVQQQPERLEREIVAVSERYQILTRFTAFVAVDRDGPLQPPTMRREVVPVALPAAWTGFRGGGGTIKVDLMPTERKSMRCGILELLMTLIMALWRWLTR